MRALLRPVVELLLGDTTVIEVVHRGQVVATVVGGEGPCVTVISSHPMWVMDPRDMTMRPGPPAPEFDHVGPVGIEVHIEPPAPVEPVETTLERTAAAVRRYRKRQLEDVDEGEAD